MCQTGRPYRSRDLEGREVSYQKWTKGALVVVVIVKDEVGDSGLSKPGVNTIYSGLSEPEIKLEEN